MNIALIAVPYDSGARGWRTGAGPEHLLRAGLVHRLQSRGHEVVTETITDDPDQPPMEVRTAFELMRRLARQVRSAREAGRFPLVLAGNCNTACGTLAGLTPRGRSVFWFDAHGDLNTPSTTASGFLDGMGLATAMGLAWEQLAAGIPRFEPVSPELVSLLGVRDLDAPELALIERCGIVRLEQRDLPAGLASALRRPALRDSLGYVHCDLDVLDPRVGRANWLPVPGGFSVDDVTAAIRAIGAAVEVGAAAIASYAPEHDRDGAIARAALDIADAVVAVGGKVHAKADGA
jgi:arginase